jgi:hypothetical protein
MNGWGEGLEKNSTKNLTMALRLFKVGPHWGHCALWHVSVRFPRASAPKQSVGVIANPRRAAAAAAAAVGAMA